MRGSILVSCARIALVQLLAVILILNLAAPLSAQFYPVYYPPPPEGPYFNPATGHWYLRLGEMNGYFSTTHLAQALGSYFVAINDAPKQLWLLDTFGTPSADTFIGLKKVSNFPPLWIWESGEPVTFTDWAPGHPVQHASFAVGLSGWQSASQPPGGKTIFESVAPLVGTLPGLSCTPAEPNVILAWEASAFDTVRIYRETQLIATVPASDLGYVDIGGGGRLLLIGESAAGVGVPARCTCVIPDDGYALRIPDVSGLHPGPVSVPILLDHPFSPVQAVTMGLCYDTDALDIVDLAPGADVVATGGGAPDWFEVSYVTGGFAFSLIPCALAPRCALPNGSGDEIVVATFQALASPPLDIPLQFCTHLGVPPVWVLVSTNGQGKFPFVVDGSMTFGPQGFIRGDGNDDGAVDIADVLFLGDRLFGLPGPDLFPCREACEANGDAQLDIADMVYTLGHLFGAGPAPEAPFPDRGGDPEPASGLGCDPGALCP